MRGRGHRVPTRDRPGRDQLQPKDAHAGRLGRLMDSGDDPERVDRTPVSDSTKRRTPSKEKPALRVTTADLMSRQHPDLSDVLPALRQCEVLVTRFQLRCGPAGSAGQLLPCRPASTRRARSSAPRPVASHDRSDRLEHHRLAANRWTTSGTCRAHVPADRPPGGRPAGYEQIRPGERLLRPGRCARSWRGSRDCRDRGSRPES